MGQITKLLNINLTVLVVLTLLSTFYSLRTLTRVVQVAVEVFAVSSQVLSNYLEYYYAALLNRAVRYIFTQYIQGTAFGKIEISR